MDPATEYHITSWYQQGRLERKMLCQCVLAIDLWTPSYRLLRVGWQLREYHETALNRRSNTGLIQVCYAKQRPIVLVGAVCDYLDSFTLPVNPVSFFLFSPLLLLETVGNLLKHCPIGPSNFSIPCWKQLTW